jgi:hypothetical protein
MDGEIINKVAASGLVEINLEDYYARQEKVVFDIAPCLYQGLVLKEKDFRAFVKEHDWKQYQNKFVAIFCSEDAIVPTWAYMLLAAEISHYSAGVIFGDLKDLDTVLMENAINQIDIESFRDAKVVVKGCGNLPIGNYAYVKLVSRLRPVVKSIMFGEPCSTVPVFKRKAT